MADDEDSSLRAELDLELEEDLGEDDIDQGEEDLEQAAVAAEDEDFDLDLAADLDEALADADDATDAVAEVLDSQIVDRDEDVRSPEDHANSQEHGEWSQEQGVEGYEDDGLDEGDMAADDQHDHQQDDHEMYTSGQAQQQALDESSNRRRDVFTSMTEEQYNRYESYRRSCFSKPKMKKVMHRILGFNPQLSTIIAMTGICKLFVGELIEKARLVASDQGYSGALLPSHIHQAYQALDRAGKVPRRHPPARLFRR